jgi:hypothetical protein
MTMMAIASVIAGGMQAASGAISGKKKTEIEQKEKEKKRKIDFASQGLDRDQASGMDLRKGNRDIAQSRAQIMQGMAQNINLGARHG